MPSAPLIIPIETDADLARSHPVFLELRPHMADLAAFIAQVRRQMTQGYRISAVEVDGEVQAVAGWRISETLAWGRFVYVDDLVTCASERSKGHGKILIRWLMEEARRNGCAQFHLDSGVQRFAAHRFYLTERMEITSHHFGLVLE